MRPFWLTVPVINDVDGDGVPDSQDAFPGDPNEWIDTDADGVGNNADMDDDNDGMQDTWEIANGLDPLDDGSVNINNGPSGDIDGDGLTNLQEYIADASQATASWAPNTESDLAGYKVYYGISSGNYNYVV